MFSCSPDRRLGSHVQKSIQELWKVRDEFQLWDRVQDSDPRDKVASRERTEDVNPVGQQGDKMRQRERLSRPRDICTTSNVVRMWHQDAFRFVRTSSNCLRLRVLGNIYRRGFGNDVLQETIK